MSTFNIGIDSSLGIVVNGSALTVLTITEFESKQISTRIESNPLNAPPASRKQPKGWEGTITYDRGSGALDANFVREETAFWAGLDGDVIQLNHTVIDPVSRAPVTYRYTGVTLEYEDGGTWKADEKVSQKVKWWGSIRTIVS